MEKVKAEELKEKFALSDEELEGVSGGTNSIDECINMLLADGVTAQEAYQLCNGELKES